MRATLTKPCESLQNLPNATNGDKNLARGGCRGDVTPKGAFVVEHTPCHHSFGHKSKVRSEFFTVVHDEARVVRTISDRVTARVSRLEQLRSRYSDFHDTLIEPCDGAKVAIEGKCLLILALNS